MEYETDLDGVESTLCDDLKKSIRLHSKMTIAGESFSIYAFEALKEELAKLDEFRFLFTSPTFTTERAAKEKREFYIPRLHRERNLYADALEIKLRNELTQRAIARECALWIQERAKFQSVREGEFKNQFAATDRSSALTSDPPSCPTCRLPRRQVEKIALDVVGRNAIRTSGQ